MDKDQVNLMRAIKMRAYNAGDNVSIDDEIANVLEKNNIACLDLKESNSTTCLLTEVTRQELGILDLLCAEGASFHVNDLESGSVGKTAHLKCLTKLVQDGLVEVKGDGRYILTKEGLLTWAKLKFDGGPVGSLDEMLSITQRWENAQAEQAPEEYSK